MQHADACIQAHALLHDLQKHGHVGATQRVARSVLHDLQNHGRVGATRWVARGQIDALGPPNLDSVGLPVVKIDAWA
jgi:hypothetical protein